MPPKRKKSGQSTTDESNKRPAVESATAEPKSVESATAESKAVESATAKPKSVESATAKPKAVESATAKPKSVKSADEINAKSMRLIQSYRFQTALLMSDRKAALAYKCVNIDNSRCWLHGHSNPVRLWSTMACVNDATDQDEIAELKDVLDILMRTGAGPLLNEISSDGKRPVDAPNSAQRSVLVDYGDLYGLDLNPTATESPLYFFIDNAVGPVFGARAIRKMNPEFFDWQHPTTNQTAFHLALSKGTERSRGMAELLVPFAAFGIIDPYHACFTSKPIDGSGSSSMSILGIARCLYDDFELVHRPARIAAAVPDLPPPLVDLVRDYAMHG